MITGFDSPKVLIISDLSLVTVAVSARITVISVTITEET